MTRHSKTMCITHQHHTFCALASFETTRVVTVTIHVESSNASCGCLFDDTTAENVDVCFKYRPKRFKLVTDCSVGFCMSPANSFVEYDRSGLSCDKYAALMTTLRYFLVCNASTSGNVVDTSSSLFFDCWSRHTRRTFQVQ